jgi:hypothetical protein
MGVVYLFDPILIQNSDILQFNSSNNTDNPTMYKDKRVEFVKWIDSFDQTRPPRHFVVVFEDGAIYIFNKDYPIRPTDDYEKDKIKVVTKNKKGEPSEKEYSKSVIIKKMKQMVENFDFESHYKN